jgi:PmbA protein
MSSQEPVAVTFDERAARDLATALVEAARRAGASWCDAAVSYGSGLSASARDGAVEEVTRDTWRAAGVRVVVDGRMGLASSADAPLRADAIEALAKDAVALARASSPSPHNERAPAAPDAAGAARVDAAQSELQMWDEETARTSPGWVAERALALDAALRAHPGIAATKDASASVRRGTFALATSWGFVGSSRGTTASLAVSGVLEEGGGKKQVEGEWDSRRARAALREPAAVAHDAALRVLARAGARKIDSERMPVIFAPEIARGFVGSVLGCACGDVVARGRSFLKDMRGAQVWAKGVRVVDDPLVPRGAASRVFDGEGMLGQRRVVIDDDGVLQMFFLDHKTAQQLGGASTGHASRGARGLPSPGPTNIVFEGGAGDLESIVRETPRGLLVTRVMGRAIDPVTGEISRGAAGFLIEGGARAFPVEEITIAGDALSLLRGMDRIGADGDARGSIRAPTLRFAQMQVSGR